MTVVSTAETIRNDTFEVLVDPPVTAALVTELTNLWARVTNAGGAVGFVAPVTGHDIRPHTVAILSRVIEGSDTLIALTRDDRVVGWCVLSTNDTPPREGWRHVRHVQIDPDLQRSGIGGRLLNAAEAVARGVLNLDALCLKIRSGTGAADFYARHGFKEVGRLPNAVKLADDDYRDDIIMWRRLRA